MTRQTKVAQCGWAVLLALSSSAAPAGTHHVVHADATATQASETSPNPGSVPGISGQGGVKFRLLQPV